MKIAVNTGGGDAPGLNAVIRGAVLAAYKKGWEVYGIKYGYKGLIDTKQIIRLTPEYVWDITNIGGTILGSAIKGNPFKYLVEKAGGSVVETDISDTAVNTATEAIDKLHTTARSHDRVMVVEVMGRYVGWIALYSGISGSADVILIPEIPFDIGKVCNKIKQLGLIGQDYAIVVVAEGAKPVGGDVTVIEKSPGEVRLGGIGKKVSDEIEEKTGKERRGIVLGPFKRGGG